MYTNVIRTGAAALLLLLSATASAVNAASVYDQTILNDRPVMFLGMGSPGAGSEADLSGHGNGGTYVGGTPGLSTLPDGEKAADFNGSSQYLTVKASPALSVPTGRALTIESWIKPDTLQFSHSEAEGYVYWLGKGNPTNGYEYANRMYSLSNTANRPNRISDYDWNTSGGLGSGAYFQDTVTTTQWIMVTDVVDMNSSTIAIYKNGVLRGRVPLSQYNVTPGTTSSPFNVGTRNYNSWFQGAVGKVAVYGYVLSDAQIANHYKAMTAAPPPPTASAPAISNVAASGQTQNGVTIGWTTDKISHSQVEYGPTTSYGTLTPRSSTTGTSHSVALSGLAAGATYHYRVKSLDDTTGLTGVSGDNTFATLPAIAAPVISNVAASGIAQTAANITWTTDKASHSQVEYGPTTSYGSLSYQSSATGTSHFIPLSGLSAGTTYHYRAKSLDDATGLTGVSGDNTFATLGAVISSVISNVQASGITSSAANITWNTTTVSHSQVEYGLTTAYGSQSYQSTATGTAHFIPLTGLKSGTTYHYRVKSLNSATGKTDVSGDYTFKTSGAGA